MWYMQSSMVLVGGVMPCHAMPWTSLPAGKDRLGEMMQESPSVARELTNSFLGMYVCVPHAAGQEIVHDAFPCSQVPCNPEIHDCYHSRVQEER